jgi:hypothetical protein
LFITKPLGCLSHSDDYAEFEPGVQDVVEREVEARDLSGELVPPPDQSGTRVAIEVRDELLEVVRRHHAVVVHERDDPAAGLAHRKIEPGGEALRRPFQVPRLPGDEREPLGRGGSAHDEDLPAPGGRSGEGAPREPADRRYLRTMSTTHLAGYNGDLMTGRERGRRFPELHGAPLLESLLREIEEEEHLSLALGVDLTPPRPQTLDAARDCPLDRWLERSLEVHRFLLERRAAERREAGD